MKKTTFSAEETIEFAVQIGKMLKKGEFFDEFLLKICMDLPFKLLYNISV